jgi:Tol biopolymer transport system component
MTLASGDRVGPYEILAPLGAGGMGEVYRARDPKLSREVALKILSAALSGDTQRRLRFEQEAQAASALNHPSVVHIYDVGSADGLHYIAMELVPGRTLREVLASGPLPAKKLLDIAVEVADGLAKAHEAGIVHRDLKPENLMVSREGHVKILDFGLAKLADLAPAGETEEPTRSRPLTREGLIMGTAGYMSPEQAAGQPVDFRSDQFSFGTILYEMASGKGPFRRKTSAETLAAILNDQPPPLARENVEIPPPLRWIVEERCLAKDPQERYRSTWDLLRDLKALRDHISEAHLPISRRPPPARLAASAAILVGGLALGIASGLLLGRRAPRQTAAALPVFRQLTFQRGSMFSARFAPDGQTVVYGAAWEGRPVEPFMTHLGSPESRPLGFPGAEILSISSSGELALSLDRHYTGGWIHSGMLARVPLAGGTPRRVLDGVEAADWAPDGASAAVIRVVAATSRLEWPIGTVLYESPGWLSHPRISPNGELVAFLEHGAKGDDRGSVAVVDKQARKRTLTGAFSSAQGLAWAPSGREVWFTATEVGASRALHAVPLSGAGDRTVLRSLGILTLQDISRDGRVLLLRDSVRTGVFGIPPGETQERDLSVGDWSIVMDLSMDGRQVSISEQGEAGGPDYAAYLRDTGSSSPAVQLGSGAGILSPDGAYLLARTPSGAQLRLLPTGPGEAKTLPSANLTYQNGNQWFPDGKRVLIVGNEPGGRIRFFVQTIADGTKRAISPEGVDFPFGSHPLSPDGTRVAALGPDGKAYLYPVEPGEPRPIPGLEPGEQPIGWVAGGRAIYVFRKADLPIRVYRLDVETGRRELWKEIAPSDAAGMVAIPRILLTPDGKAYVYNIRRILSELYLAEGLISAP